MRVGDTEASYELTNKQATARTQMSEQAAGVTQ